MRDMAVTGSVSNAETEMSIRFTATVAPLCVTPIPMRLASCSREGNPDRIDASTFHFCSIVSYRSELALYYPHGRTFAIPLSFPLTFSLSSDHSILFHLQSQLAVFSTAFISSPISRITRLGPWVRFLPGQINVHPLFHFHFFRVISSMWHICCCK